MGKCTDFTKDGVCSKCGACCSTHLPVTAKEIKALKRWAKKHNYKPARVAVGAYDFNMTCPFLDPGTNQCVCYEVRPEICRDFKCDIAESPALKRKYQNGVVHDLRKEIFNEDTLPIAQAQAFLSYIENRRKKNE